MEIFKLLFLSYLHTSLHFYHANSIAMFYILHNQKKKFKSANMDLTHSLILIFTSFPVRVYSYILNFTSFSS